MKKVRLLGVPEHFNFPWHLAIDEGAFEARGIELEWIDIPEGSGEMCQILNDGQADLAIVLTEAMVKSITQGNPSKIVQEFIGTPLQWGIHVGAESPYTSISHLKNKKVAISRFGSGSHLMTYVHGKAQGWDTDKLKFAVINGLEGASEALTNGSADYFLWEHFTTKPLVDKGIFRRLGDCPTPWPCFVVTATNIFLKEHSRILKHILEIINLYTSEFKAIPSIDRTLANKYGQKLEDIQDWISITGWSQFQLSQQNLEKVQNTLFSLSLIDEKVESSEILAFLSN